VRKREVVHASKLFPLKKSNKRDKIERELDRETESERAREREMLMIHSFNNTLQRTPKTILFFSSSESGKKQVVFLSQQC